MASNKLSINKPKIIALKTIDGVDLSKIKYFTKLKTIVNESTTNRRQPLVRVAYHDCVPKLEQF